MLSKEERYKFSHLYVAFLLAFFVYLSYFKSLSNPFIWDDLLLIKNNPGITGGWKSIFDAFSPSSWGLRADHEAFKSFFRPFHTVTSIIDYNLWGLDPSGHHFSNTLFHLVNTFLLYIITNLFLKRQLVSILAAAIFAVHPVHTESVCFISARVDLICGIFFLLTFIFYILSSPTNTKNSPKKNRRLYLFSLLLFLCALLSKEMALTLPLLVALYSFIYEERCYRVKRMVPYFVMLAGYLAFRIVGLSSFLGQHKPRADFLPLLYTMSVTVVEYCRLLLFPYPLKAYYSLVWYQSVTIKVFISFAVILGAFFLILWLWKKSLKLLAFLLAWIFITLLPVLNIGSLGDFSMAERYAYIPSMGFSIFMAILLFSLWENKKSKLIPASIGVILLILAGLTVQRNFVWGDPALFYQDMVKGAPDSPLPHANLASVYSEKGELHKAIEEFQKTSKLAKKNKQFYYEIGLLYIKIGEPETAIVPLTNAIALKNDYEEAHNTLGIAYAEMGELEKAQISFKEAFRINPGSKEAISNLEKIEKMKTGR